MTLNRSNEMRRLLLITGDESLREHVQQSLEYFGQLKFYWVAQPDIAVTRVQDLLPHVILLDDGDVVNPSALVRELLAVSPGTSVVMLLEQETMAQAQQVVLAGARSFLVKPFTAAELTANLNEIVAGRRGADRRTESSAPGGHVVAFCAPKGGTGRTSIAVNTAIAIHQQSKQSVALLDADFAAPALDVALNLHNRFGLTDLLDRISQLDADLIENVVAHHGAGIDVLTAPDPGTMEKPVSLPQVQQILGQFKRLYPWTLIDLGLPLDDTYFAYLDAADRIVVTVLPEMTGLRNTRLLLHHFQQRGYTAKVRLVLNRADIKGGISLRDIEQRLHVKVHHTVPDDQPLVSHSVNRGVPLLLSHPRSAVGRSLYQLGTRLQGDLVGGRTDVGTEHAAKPSLLQRYLRRDRPAET